jgi:hypothetical protein
VNFKKHMRERFSNVEALTEYLIELAINDYGGEGIIWELLKETGEDHYTRDTFKYVAYNILYKDNGTAHIASHTVAI